MTETAFISIKILKKAGPRLTLCKKVRAQVDLITESCYGLLIIVELLEDNFLTLYTESVFPSLPSGHYMSFKDLTYEYMETAACS